MRIRRTAVAMVVATGAMLLATGGAVAGQATAVDCEDQSPGKRGGECKGTKSRDDIQGTYFKDQITALGNDELVRAYYGNDWVEGGPGNDKFFGGDGDDTLYGGEGRDVLLDEDPFGRSSANPSYTPPSPDTDRVSGGADDDRIDVHDGDADDVVSCGEGRDTVRFDKIGTASDKLEGCEVRYPNPDYGNAGW